LQTLYALFFIEIGTRRVYIAGTTPTPTQPWVVQQARQFVWQCEAHERRFKYLIHDRDSKFTVSFDAIFVSEGIHILKTPIRAPNANAYAERWVRSVREECLDKLLILNQAHLEWVLRHYGRYYNEARPHQGLYQAIPNGAIQSSLNGDIHRNDVLGGIIHDYQRVA
jgi:hypothetical protein